MIQKIQLYLFKLRPLLKSILIYLKAYKLFLRLIYRYNTWRCSKMNEEQYRNSLTKWYLRYTGERLDLNNPQTINEKWNWLKLYDHNPLRTTLSDKYRVRDWVRNKIGDEYLIHLIGVWENANDINFDLLPQQFVLKINHGSGFNIIVKDKNKLNIKKARKQLSYWLHINSAFFMGRFDLQYKDVVPCIIAEEYIENIDNDLYDYKFHCFGGEPKFCWLVTGRHSNLKQMHFDMNWEPQIFTWNKKYPIMDYIYVKPNNFDIMVSLAKTLCHDFKYVRVDFYNVNGRIYFGEMTFIHGSGGAPFIPNEYNLILGDLLHLGL